MSSRKVIHFSPAQIILVSIMLTIIVGTLLLALPFSRVYPIPPLDLFFTATSATCVTGLFTIPLSDFTFFGHFVILALIQIGGIGLITLTVFLMSLFVNIGMATQLMTGQILDIDQWKHVRKIVLFIILLTVISELVGAFLIFFAIHNDFSFGSALFLSLFHSISSFCNAGISLFPNELLNYSQSYLMLLTTIGLIIIGGLGFLSWKDLVNYWKARAKGQRYAISLTTKIILYGSLSITLFSALLFWIIERHNTLAPINNPVLAALNAILQGLALRGTGFTLVNIWQLHLVTFFLAMMVSFIGFAPGSTGSGVKVTTFFVFLATIRAAITGRSSVEIKERTIPIDQVYKAIAIIALGIGWIVFTTFCLLITERYCGFFPLFFEAASAFATLGISTGITAGLTIPGKILIIASMVIGRIGSLTLILALRKRALSKRAEAEFSYPEERIMLS
jgi:trk system potassium uptake protein TrkH